MGKNILKFFDIYKQHFVDVSQDDVTKFIFKRHNGELRYGLHAIVTDGQSSTKFISKKEWDALDVPIRKDSPHA